MPVKISTPSRFVSVVDETPYDPTKDRARLGGMRLRIFDAMLQENGLTPAELESHVHGQQTSISAQMRDLRKPHFGGHTVLKRKRTGYGIKKDVTLVYEYVLIPQGQKLA